MGKAQRIEDKCMPETSPKALYPKDQDWALSWSEKGASPDIFFIHKLRLIHKPY